MKTYKSLTHNKRRKNAKVLYLGTISNEGNKNNQAVRTRDRMMGTSQTSESNTLKNQCNICTKGNLYKLRFVIMTSYFRLLLRYAKSPRSNKIIAKTKMQLYPKQKTELFFFQRNLFGNFLSNSKLKKVSMYRIILTKTNSLKPFV